MPDLLKTVHDPGPADPEWLMGEVLSDLGPCGSRPGDRAFHLALARLRKLLQGKTVTKLSQLSEATLERYWRVGECLVAYQSAYRNGWSFNERVIPRLARHLCREFGEGYSEENLRAMMGFHQVWAPSTQSTHDGWWHYVRACNAERV